MITTPVRGQSQSSLSISNFQPSSVAQQQAITTLDNVVNLNFSKYTTSLSGDSNSTYLGVSQQEIDLRLASNQSSMRITCGFVGNLLHQIYISDTVGSLALKQQASSELETTEGFLQRYQNFSGNPFYGTLSSMLTNVKAGENTTKTYGNIELKVSVFDQASTNFMCTYVDENGTPAPSKDILLSFNHGQLESFLDNWQLYTVTGIPKLSAKEAQATALEAVQTLSYTVTTASGNITVSQFKIAAVGTPTLCYLNYMNFDSARGRDPFTLYPSWCIPLGFDKVYPGGVTGAVVRVWADTEEVSSVNPMVSEGAPSAKAEIALSNTPSQTSTGAIAFGLALGALAACFASKKVGMAKFTFKFWTTLLCTLAFSSLILTGISAVQGNVRSEEYASYWNQIDIEQQYAHDYVTVPVGSEFLAAGYSNNNNCGSATTYSNMMYNVQYDETNYDRTAVFYFGHMRDSSKISGTDESIITSDDVRTQTNGYPNKHYFVWLWACNSADNEQWSPSTEYMAAAWTNRSGLSSDGYLYPDSNPDCFIGFDHASPCLNYSIFDNNAVQGYQFIRAFYDNALVGCYSVHDSLNQASETLFGTTYENSELRCNFTTYYPGGGGQNATWGWGMMKVYGNSNIKLHYETLTALARNNYGNPVNDAHFSMDGNYFGYTGTTLYPSCGTHAFDVTVPSGYSFDHWEFSRNSGGTSYYWTHPANIDTYENCTLTAYFNTQYSLTISTGSGGSTNPSPGTYQYNQGTNVQVTANQNSGYQFDHWTLDGSTYTQNPITVTMNANHNLQANFVPLYTLSISSGSGGYTNPSGSPQYTQGTQAQVTAYANSGYQFDHWILDGNSYSQNPITVTMNSNHNLQANFAQQSSVIFQDGFESGNFNAWTGTTVASGCSLTTATSPVYTGSYSAHAQTNANGKYACPYYDPAATQSTLYTRLYVNFAAFNNETYPVLVWYQTAGGANNIAYVRIVQYSQTQATMQVYDYPNSQTYTSSPFAFGTGVWHCVELRATIGSSTGVLQAWLDDTQMINQANVNVGTSNIGRVLVGDAYCWGADNLYFDTVAMGTAYNGPVSGGSSGFADGFESGSFNAWTGTSVTSGDTLAVVSSPVHDGSYAAHAVTSANGDNANVYYDESTAKQTLYTRMYVRYSQWNSNTYPVLIWYQSAGGSTPIAYVRLTQYSSTQAIMQVADYATYQVYDSSPFDFSANTWYSVELRATVGSSAGVLQAWLDGSLKIDLSNLNLGSASIGRVNVGCAYSWGADNLYFDTVNISENYI